MGNVLADLAYQSLNNIVENIHRKIYKGNRDRNRYQLTSSLYVWWENGRIVRIFDCAADKKLEIGVEKQIVANNTNGFGPIGFYVDVQHMLDEAICQTANPKTVQTYTALNDLARLVRSDVSVLFEAI